MRDGRVRELRAKLEALDGDVPDADFAENEVILYLVGLDETQFMNLLQRTRRLRRASLGVDDGDI